MSRRGTPLLFCALLAVLILTLGAAMAFAAPRATASAITVTAPAGSVTVQYGDPITVSWRLDTPVTGGYFCVFVKDMNGQKQQSLQVSPVKGLAYTTTVPLDVAAGATYYVTVDYRPRRNVAPTMTADSPGTFTIPPLPFPFQTMTSSPAGESVVRGDPHTFRFWIDHPDPAVVIVSGVIEFRNARTRALVATLPITDIPAGAWVVDSTWVETPPPNATTIVCDLPVGGYSWMVRVTTSAGASAGGDEGYLSVTRR